MNVHDSECCVNREGAIITPHWPYISLCSHAAHGPSIIQHWRAIQAGQQFRRKHMRHDIVIQQPASPVQLMLLFHGVGASPDSMARWGAIWAKAFRRR
jgi:hypothetical protein